MRNIIRIALFAIAVAGASLATGLKEFQTSNGCTTEGSTTTCCIGNRCCTLDYSQAGMNGGRPVPLCN